MNKQNVLFSSVVLVLLLSPLAAGSDLLVVMNGSGRIERYDGQSGKHQGTFIHGVNRPAGIAWGPDGNLYISTGAVGGPGKVKRYHGKTGAFLGDFVAYSRGQNGFLARGNGILFHDGDLYVASCDNGKILRYNGKTGQWIADFAAASVGGITQIRFHQGCLYSADFHTAAIRKYNGKTGAFLGNQTALPGFSPWGLVFDTQGAMFWSGSGGTIQKFDGRANTAWAGTDGSLKIPLWLEIGQDGKLYCSDWGGNKLVVYSGTDAAAGTPVRRIDGPEVKGPVGVAFTEHPMPHRTVLRLGDWEAAGASAPCAKVRIEARSDSAMVHHLGWDTEGGDRARHNLLRSPLDVSLRIGGQWRSAAELPARCEVLPVVREHLPSPASGEGPGVRVVGTATSHIRYHLTPAPGSELVWEIETANGQMQMRFSSTGPCPHPVQGLRLSFPFDPRLAATTVISGAWARDNKLRLPAILSAPDLGQMLVSCAKHPKIEARLEGSRSEQWVDFTLDLPSPDAAGYALEFRPVVLPPPLGSRDTARWAAGRRGWSNFLQVNAQRGAEGGNPGSPAGVWANNVISNPVSSTVFWLGDNVLLVPELAPGVHLGELLRRSVEYWMDEKISPEGEIYYTEQGPGPRMMDSNPSVLIGAWCYVEASGDRPWLAARIDRLEFISRYTEKRDVDGDGLVESHQSGNRGTHTFGDTAWDTYSSGHKNAYVNALVYRALRSMADLESQLGRKEKQAHYARLADRLKAVYEKTFYNPQTGWLGFWRSQDAMLHDVATDVVTDMAIMYGLVDRASGRRMLDAYWTALEKSGFKRFDLGVPLNIRPVHRDDQVVPWGGKKEDGSDTFGKYLNGGCCVSNAYFFILGNYLVGNDRRAEMVLDAMLKRQREGVFPNGGGFQNGVIDRYPEGAEFFDWQGNTCGYEGHLVYSWMFLQAMLLREPELFRRVFRPLQ